MARLSSTDRAPRTRSLQRGYFSGIWQVFRAENETTPHCRAHRFRRIARISSQVSPSWDRAFAWQVAQSDIRVAPVCPNRVSVVLDSSDRHTSHLLRLSGTCESSPNGFFCEIKLGRCERLAKGGLRDSFDLKLRGLTLVIVGSNVTAVLDWN